MEMAETIEVEEESLEEKTKMKVEEPEEPMVIEEIEIEELSIDGICGVY